MLVTSGVNMAMAAQTPITQSEQIAPIPIVLDERSGVKNEDGSITYQVVNAQAVAAYYGLDNPEQVTVTKFDKRDQAQTPVTQSVYIDNVRGPYQSCGTKVIFRSEAQNRTNSTVTKTVEIAASVSNTYEKHMDAGFDISAASISAGVGFDVTHEWELRDTTEVVVEPHSAVSVKVYPMYDTYQFDVIDDPLFGSLKKVGSGNALECVGFCTITSAL